MQRTVRRLRASLSELRAATCFDGAIFALVTPHPSSSLSRQSRIGTTISPTAQRDALDPARTRLSRHPGRAAAAAYKCLNALVYRQELPFHQLALFKWIAPPLPRSGNTPRDASHARARARPEPPACAKRDFDEFLAVAPELPTPGRAELRDREVWNRDVFPKLVLHRPTGHSELNIARVARGLGFFDVLAGRLLKAPARSRNQLSNRAHAESSTPASWAKGRCVAHSEGTAGKSIAVAEKSCKRENIRRPRRMRLTGKWAIGPGVRA